MSTVDEHVERILSALLPLPPYDQPLLEALGLPVCEDITAPMDLQEVLFELQMQNYQPIIAHPERYTYLQHKKSFYRGDHPSF